MLKSSATNTGLAIAVSTLLGSPLVFAQSPEEVPAEQPREATEPGQEVPAEEATVQETTAQDATAPAGQEIQEVVIRGENIPEPMVTTAEISSFLLPEDLQRQGDDTAAAALRRVTGLSLNQGKFVYVRGLGERYSSALLNGSALPSPEPLQRVVPLDLFPSNIIENVLVQKTYSAKYPGEFGGGLIDMQTVAVPDKPFLTVSFSTGGDTETTFKDGITHYGSDRDFLGFDDDTRDMPSALSEAVATGRRVDVSNFSPEELQRMGHSLVNA
ncbi:MAG: TonB-dependent receptor plug domain-containing protein, partial [Steroidobacteraceae bacterium]